MAGRKGVAGAARAASIVACLLVSGTLHSQSREAGWLLIRSDDVEVLSDAGEAEGRLIHARVAAARGLLAEATGHYLGDTVEPIRVLAPRGTDGMRAVVGEAARRNPGLLTAAALPSPFGHHLAVRADSSRASSTAVLQHELVHLITADVLGEVPAWLDEGLAEFWSTVERRQSGIEAGQPIGGHLRVLGYADRWIPWHVLQSVPRGRYDLARAPVGVFYAQSWLAVHFLLTAPGAAGSFAPAPDAVTGVSDATLRGYVAAPRAAVGVRSTSPLAAPVTATVARLPLADADASRAAVMVFGESPAQAEALAMAVVRTQPSHALALRTLGLAAFLDNRPEEARDWLRRSLAENDSDYLAHYYLAVLMAGNPTLEVQHLERCLELRPGLEQAKARLKEIRLAGLVAR